MVWRIAGLTVIFLGTTAAWWILTGVLALRTQDANGDAQVQLGSLWGPEQTQTAPHFSVQTAKGKRDALPFGSRDLSIDASRIAVQLALEERRKSLLWYNAYLVNYDGAYRVTSPRAGSTIAFALDFPAQNAVF